MSQPTQASPEPATSAPGDGMADDRAARRKRRRRRRFLRAAIWLTCVVVFLGCIFVLIDKTVTSVAQDKVATKLTGQQPFTGRPKVVIHGFPFLTQAARGKYSDIEVTGPGQPVAKLGIAQIDAHLHGVHIPLSAVGTGVGSVPVDHADVSVTLPASRLGPAFGVPGLKLSQSGRNVRVLAPLLIAGLASVKVDALARLTVRANAIAVMIVSVKIGGAAAPAAVVEAAKQGLGLNLPLGNLGLNVHAATARVVGSNLVISGSADNVTLH